MSVLQRLRGVVGTALTWASGWGLIGAGLHAVALYFGWNGFVGVTWAGDVLAHAAMGLLGGAVYSGGLLLTERGRTLRDLRIAPSGLWGGLAGAVGAAVVFALLGGVGLLPELWPALLAGGVLGAGSGAGMAAIAREEGRKLETAEEPSLIEGAGS